MPSNMRRGLFRFWLLSSGAWLAYWIWRGITDCHFIGVDYARLYCKAVLPEFPDPWTVIGQEADTIRMIFEMAILALGVPLAILALGIGARWVTRGFRAFH